MRAADVALFSGAYTASRYGYFSIVPTISLCNAIIAEVINQAPRHAAQGMERYKQVVLTSRAHYTQYARLALARDRRKARSKSGQGSENHDGDSRSGNKKRKP